MIIKNVVLYSASFQDVDYDDDKYVKVVAATIEEAFQKIKEAFPDRIISHLYAETNQVFRDDSKPPRWTVLV